MTFKECFLTRTSFHEATHLTASDWGELQHTVRHQVLRYFRRHGLLKRHVTDDRPLLRAAYAGIVPSDVLPVSRCEIVPYIETRPLARAVKASRGATCQSPGTSPASSLSVVSGSA